MPQSSFWISLVNFRSLTRKSPNAMCPGRPGGQPVRSKANLGQECGLRWASNVPQGQIQPSEDLVEGLGTMGDADSGVLVKGSMGRPPTPHLIVTIILCEYHERRVMLSPPLSWDLNLGEPIFRAHIPSPSHRNPAAGS